MKTNNKELLRGLQSFKVPAARISGIGSYLPDMEKNNAEIIAPINIPPRLKANLPGIIERTALMRTRRCAAPDLYPSDLGVFSVLDAIHDAGRKKDDIDTLIFASTDTDQLEPATANILQQKLGIKSVNAFDVSNACNSFLQALNVGNSLIATGAAKCIAICASELGTHWICPDLNNKDELRQKMGALTLGDASAAVILEPAYDSTSGISEINLFSLGEYWHLCHVPENINWRKDNPRSIQGWFYLDMSELARIVRPLTVEYFQEYGDYRKLVYGEDEILKNIDRIIPHQISKRLIEEVAKILNVSMDRIGVTADQYGNTASAAIPLTLHKSIQSGKLSIGSGQEVFLFGAASGLGMGHIRLKL